MEFKYGKGYDHFVPPSDHDWQLLSGENTSQAEDGGKGILLAAIEKLIFLIKRRRLSEGAKILLIIPDHTRRCRIDEVLKELMPALEREFRARYEILIANGSHEPVSEAELLELVGDTIFNRYPVAQHIAEDTGALYWVGETKFGTPIWLNKKVRDAQQVITIGGILFHYFAGFGGGAKMLLPGVAGLETIRCNHQRTIDPHTGRFHPDCQEGNIDSNPVFLDLAQVVEFLPHAISLQLALSADNDFLDVQAGDVLITHRRLCETVRAVYGVAIDFKADVVIAGAGGHPADVNLIQSHKSIHHAFQALREKGVLIIVAECAEGVGSKYFMPYFDSIFSEDIAARLLKDYQINGHTALALKHKTEHATIFLVSRLEEEIVHKTGMIPAKNMEQAWAMAQNYLPRSYKGYLFPNAAKYVPYGVPAGVR